MGQSRMRERGVVLCTGRLGQRAQGLGWCTSGRDRAMDPFLANWGVGERVGKRP